MSTLSVRASVGTQLDYGCKKRGCPRPFQLLVAATIVCSMFSAGCEFFGIDVPPTMVAPSQIALQKIAEGFVSPVGAVAPPDGSHRLFVLDQVGQIRVVDASGNLLSTPFLDLSGKMVSVGIDFGGGIFFDERGLIGLAFHPNYSQNGKFYVFYTAPKGAGQPTDFDSESHISEFKVSTGDANVADPASERLLLTIGKPQFNHNGGQLAFGRDGFLYIGVGDGGNANDEGTGHTADTGNGQDKTTLLGKILRIDVNSGSPYTVPSDNPLMSDATAKHEIFALGMRNPWRFSFDALGSGRMFVADVGQDQFEELDIVTKGGNYGWRVREGLHCFDPASPGNSPASCAAMDAESRPLIDPIIEYPHTATDPSIRGIAVVGGFVYRGSAIPSLYGHYVYGDYSRDFFTPDGSLLVATEDANGKWTTKALTVAGQDDGRPHAYIQAFGQDDKGELYLLTTDVLGPTGTTGKLNRIVAAP